MRNKLKATRLQLYTFLASMPIIDVILNYILYDEQLFRDWRIWLFSFPLIYLIGLGSWKGHVMIANLVNNRYPNLKQTRKRLLILGFSVLPFMSLCMLLIFFFYDALHILGYVVDTDDLKSGLITGFSINIIFETLYQADFVLEKYKESVEEKKDLQELTLQSEFDTLKNQVNPHFLFNCFNTLSSLISVDKERAEDFLNELSKVYRYLLRNNEDGLSTVDSELRFIESYYRLLQTRHGDAVQLRVETDKRYGSYLLPSLSLQLLVENAVKHNTNSKEKPLVIDIFTTAGNKLVVNNNLQRRPVKLSGARVGLKNIRLKYQLLRQNGFQVMEDDKNFTVVLPLLWNNTFQKDQQSIKEIKTN